MASLVAITHEALEQGKKVEGIGWNPTIKALIWNPAGAEDEG